MRLKLVEILWVLQLTEISGCDEFSWHEVRERYEKCILQNGAQSLERQNLVSPQLCQKLDDVQDCREYLDFCEESHAGEIRGHRFRPKLEQLKRRCPPLARTKRSAKKPGGNGRSTARRVVDKVKQKGRQVVDKIRNRGRGGQSNYGRGGQSNYGGNTGGGLSGTQHKESRKKKILKKVGKYAVAGLAVYGTYKLAKAMTKGLRGAYDTDDCWDYSYMRGQYECVCPGQCQVYVGSATTWSIASGCLAFSLALSCSASQWAHRP